MAKKNQKWQSNYPVDIKTSYKIMRLSTALLTSGQAYQRSVTRRHVDKIIRNYDPRLMDEIIVNCRGGKYYVIDGQHRITALREMNNGVDVIVTCKVYYGLTYQQEAEFYHLLDAAKTKLNTKDDVRSMFESGEFPNIEDIKKVLKANGIEWNFTSSNGRDNSISAIRETIKAYDELGFSGFARMIRIIKEAWHGEGKSLTMYILSGMTLFLKTYGDMVDDATLVKQLSKCSPDEIARMGKADLSTNYRQLRYAKAILARYNLHKRDKLPYRFEV